MHTMNNKERLDLALIEWNKAGLDEPIYRSRNEGFQTSQNKQESTKRFFCNQLQDYCDESNLHAVKYLGDSSRAVIERLCWAVTIIVSLVGISVLILRVRDRWITSPVSVSTAESPTPIWQIPFPTVTVCPQVKYVKSLVNREELEARRENLTENELQLVNDLQLICNNNASRIKNFTYPNFSDEKTIDNIVKVFPKRIVCFFKNTNCDQEVQAIITRNGQCFSFNALPHRSVYSKSTMWSDVLDVPSVCTECGQMYSYNLDFFENNYGRVQRATYAVLEGMEFWSLEGGYTPYASMTSPPLRASGTGFQKAVSLYLGTNLTDMDHHCSEVQGFKIALNNPAEVPRMKEKFFYIPQSGVTYIIVEPKVMQTSDSLRTYTPDKRHCYFSSDRELKYFTTYTQSNCEVECLTDFTLRKCGCVEFYMPRNISTPMCGFGRRECTVNAERQLLDGSMRDSVKHIKNDNACNCLPECQSIKYAAEVSQGTYETCKILQAENGVPDTSINCNQSATSIVVNALHVFFKDSEFYANQRNELYGYADFIANCGGLLGLCCGFSILSLVELIYYFTLRLWVNYRRMKKGDTNK